MSQLLSLGFSFFNVSRVDNPPFLISTFFFSPLGFHFQFFLLLFFYSVTNTQIHFVVKDPSNTRMSRDTAHESSLSHPLPSPLLSHSQGDTMGVNGPEYGKNQTGRPQYAQVTVSERGVC